MRIQFVPFPRMKPRQPSSRPIFTKAFQIDNLYSVRPTLWIWRRIFNRSSGDTIVLETAPATPPAMNAATTGSARFFLVVTQSDRGGSLISSCFNQQVSLPAHRDGEWQVVLLTLIGFGPEGNLDRFCKAGFPAPSKSFSWATFWRSKLILTVCTSGSEIDKEVLRVLRCNCF